MRRSTVWLCWLVCLIGTTAVATHGAAVQSPESADSWTCCGWGGGGFYYSAAFDPKQDGVIYMGGDVCGVYKTTDHGKSWKIINNGLVNYGVFSLAVDPTNTQTVYAASEGGLCKSTDGGEHWQLLPKTDRKDLRITGEKGRSVRCIAVDPTDGNVIYAASPAGKVYKSTDAGNTWNAVYQKKAEEQSAGVQRVQFGKVNGAFFGGMWCPLAFPADVKSEDCAGFAFAFKGSNSVPKDAFLTLKTSSGAAYRSKNLRDLFGNGEWQDVLLKAEDFTVDPEYAHANPDKAKTLPASPDWSTVNRMDFACVGDLPREAFVTNFGKISFAVTHSPDGTATADKPVLLAVKDLSTSKDVSSYGNVRIGQAAGGSIYSVAIAPKDHAMVVASTADAGLVLSEDAGQNWKELKTPKHASAAAFDPADSNTIYGAFATDGIWKSTDKGQTWTDISAGLIKDFAAKEIVVSPANSQDVYAIGAVGWGGGFYLSHDGGQTWKSSSSLAVDSATDPTLQGGETARTPLSIPTNLTINPQNPKELFISANWRSCLSDDGGATWAERNAGADISVVTDIRFHKGSTYVTAMDEGVFKSDDDGGKWQQLWPKKYIPDFTGHFWRVAISDANGVERIITSGTPWDAKYPNHVVYSEDGGKSYKDTKAGLPDHSPTVNTMWDRGYARALAQDPKNPMIVYLGIDGDAADGKGGGGIFKSEDGGATWKQLPNQPGSRRMFFGLAVDPTDSNRIYWGACNTGGGLYRSDDAGASWKLVFSNETWIFNVLVTADGTVYCPGKNLWRSTDHGQTWQQISKFSKGGAIVGLEVDPRNPKTIWISTQSWGGGADGAVYKTTDGGSTWNVITGDLPYVNPMILRFNPATNELWAGGVGLYRIKQ